MLDRIKALIINLIDQGVLTYDDVNEIKDIYWKQVTKKGNLSISDMSEFQDWHRNWNPLRG